MANILLVEDDFGVAAPLARLLVKEGYGVTHVASLLAARSHDWNAFDLVVLDWNLPDGEGVDLLRDVRAASPHVPVLMLTARSDVADRVRGLDGGACDYIVKPFEPREFLARVRVQVRRSHGQSHKAGPVECDDSGASPVAFTAGPFELDERTHGARYLGKELGLTRMEFALLCFLAKNENRVFSREELLTKVWGVAKNVTTRTVDTHILQLRQKSSPELFETLRGVGYRFKGSKK